MAVFFKHCPWLEDHNSASKLTNCLAFLQLVCFVVSSEVTLESERQSNFLIELIVLHFVEIHSAELCVLQKPLVSLLILLLPLGVSKQLFEVMSVEHDRCSYKVAVFLHFLFWKQVYVIFHQKYEQRASRTNESYLIVFDVLVEFVINVVIVDILNFRVRVGAKLLGLSLIEQIVVNECYFLDLTRFRG